MTIKHMKGGIKMRKGKKHSKAEQSVQNENVQEQTAAAEEEVTQEAPEETAAKAAAEAAAEIEAEEQAADAASSESSEEKGEDAKNEGNDQIAALEEEISKRDETIALMHDKLQRQMAEFDNFRKRTEKEKSDMFSMGVADILKKLLPVVDNFERGFNTIPEGEEKTQFAVGMDMVYKQLMKTLEDNKVTPIDAVGKEFDPQFHNAVQHVEKDDVGENIVVEEYEKGYMYGDTVLRHSMVIVAN